MSRFPPVAFLLVGLAASPPVSTAALAPRPAARAGAAQAGGGPTR